MTPLRQALGQTVAVRLIQDDGLVLGQVRFEQVGDAGLEPATSTL